MVIGSPGSYKDHFLKYLVEVAEKKKSSTLKILISKAILVHCTSGFKHSLNEILHKKEIQSKIEDMGCYSESLILDQFFEELRTSDNKVCYGINSVKYALENSAVETLLISDHLFRSKNN
jgi:protein pelota